MRKKAVHAGTFGSYYPMTGICWDAKCDVDTAVSTGDSSSVVVVVGIDVDLDLDVDTTVAINKNTP